MAIHSHSQCRILKPIAKYYKKVGKHPLSLVPSVEKWFDHTIDNKQERESELACLIDLKSVNLHLLHLHEQELSFNHRVFSIRTEAQSTI